MQGTIARCFASFSCAACEPFLLLLFYVSKWVVIALVLPTTALPCVHLLHLLQMPHNFKNIHTVLGLQHMTPNHDFHHVLLNKCSVVAPQINERWLLGSAFCWIILFVPPRSHLDCWPLCVCLFPCAPKTSDCEFHVHCNSHAKTRVTAPGK